MTTDLGVELPDIIKTRANLAEFVSQKNSDNLTDAAIQLVLGVPTCFFTYLVIWIVLAGIIGGDMFSWPVLVAFTIYFGAAFYSAWQDVDPFQGLPAPDSQAGTHWIKAELEDVVGPVGGNVGSRAGLAGMASFLISGPKLLIGAYNRFAKYMSLSRTDLDNCASTLLELAESEQLDPGAAPREFAILQHFDLIYVQPNHKNELKVVLNAKSKPLCRD